MPVLEPTVATMLLPLLHVPPEASDKEVVEPEHNEVLPDIGPGVALTVTIVMAVALPQPLVTV